MDETIWMTGGRTDDGTVLQTTEYVTLQTSVRGSDLPEPLLEHCMVQINSNVIGIFGGLNSQYEDTNKVYFYDLKTGTWTSGPEMFYAKGSVACSKIFIGGNEYVIVVTRFDESDEYTEITEFMNIKTLDKWIKGMHFHLVDELFLEIRNWKVVWVSKFHQNLSFQVLTFRQKGMKS